MPRLTASILTLAALLPITACGGGDPHMEAAEESVDTLNDLASVLAKITDKESAEAHVDELEGVVGDMKSMTEKMEALGDPSEEAMKNIQTLPGFEEATKKMTSEMMRVMSNPEIAAVIGPVMEKMGG